MSARALGASVKHRRLTLASPCEKACEAWIQTAQRCNDRRHHEGDGLAAALGPWRGCGAQEARLDTDIGEGRGRTHVSCDGRPTVQIEAEDCRSIGRLAMALVDPRAIEGEIDCIRSLGLEELRREWRRLNHGEPPRISRDLLILALGYRLQEVARGGLGKATQRKLQTMAKALQTTGPVPQPEARRASCSGMARPHAHRHRHGRWVRVWRGELSVPDQDRQNWPAPLRRAANLL